MIIGSVTPGKEAIVEITVTGPGGSLSVLAMLDTGFNGHLTLPKESIQKLGLKPHSVATAKMADGTIVSLVRFSAQVRWLDTDRQIFVLAAESSSLLGMALMYGTRVSIDVVDGGNVVASVIQ